VHFGDKTTLSRHSFIRFHFGTITNYCYDLSFIQDGVSNSLSDRCSVESHLTYDPQHASGMLCKGVKISICIDTTNPVPLNKGRRRNFTLQLRHILRFTQCFSFGSSTKIRTHFSFQERYSFHLHDEESAIPLCSLLCLYIN